ncbi:Bax inhibitor-1/YccA family protein [Mucilaginibacter flavidus]|uniref:Bax inhibitor-1/YccA family protein n=1 Tax=Mucilaginibacter flavidus TaxID=2949309 RepID=UPI00209312A1|nr:Bax inhibitor-1/YccA family protein [Mucilaginibacter flavidus]MCO5947173.1 Bax inhibitor-1/YccA family protein [Mucilaginibacter flavidus]
MEINNPNYDFNNVIQINDTDASRKFLASVFMWMFVALGVSAGIAYLFNADQGLRSIIQDPTTNSITGIGLLAMISPLIFVLVMRFGLNRLSYGVLALIFVAYAAVTGISFSIILKVYTDSSVLGVFLTSSVVFGIMAIAGYTTKTDLTKFGSILIMFLIGIIVASLVNMFIHSTGLNMLISYIGVAVFVGLTAYDVQKLKQIGAGLTYGDATASKMALMGGLTLYLDFINLFLFLLRIFGRRR